MDRELQERVVGAIVLVVVAVLVVPIFLDGSTDDVEIITESVALPGQGGGQPETQKIVLNRDRSEPVPVTAPAQAAVAEPEARVEPQAAAPAEQAPPETGQAVPDAARQESATARIERRRFRKLDAGPAADPVLDSPYGWSGRSAEGGGSRIASR